MSWMSDMSEDIGWNQCLDYLINHLDNLKETLSGGQYDYFPEDDFKKFLESLKKEEWGD